MKVALLLFVGACASGTYANHEFRGGQLDYRTGALSPDWRMVSVQDANLTFHHKDGGAILANGICGEDIEDLPLDVLTNHLLFGVEKVQELGRQQLTLDGRGAERTQLRGEVDGVPVHMDLVVLKKDGCTFDFQLLAGKSEIDARRPDFEAFFKGFTKLSTKK